VDRAIEIAEARHVTASLVQGLALRALVEQARGEISSAAESITRALEHAGPGRFTRRFIDLGPRLTGLLAELASHGALPKGGQRVLMACWAESVAPTLGLPNRVEAAPNLVEALTWRELDVLLLMEGHFTNKEIARLLGLDDETVKRHATNIYRKLRVSGRRDAVLRAYDLGFLRAENRETPPSH
jgi:LuxR family transcriptional regulator, maltose regulon positive regulatory protein